MPHGFDKKLALLPKYFKNPHDLKNVVQPGQRVSLKVRFLNFKTGVYELITTEYFVEGVEVNCLLVANNNNIGIPWYAIHDWNIIPDF